MKAQSTFAYELEYEMNDYFHKQYKSKIRKNKRKQRAYIEKIQTHRLNTIKISFCAILFVLYLLSYIYLYTNIQTTQKSINKLQYQIEMLKESNKVHKSSLATTIPLFMVKEKALSLGMKEPTDDQIIYYKVQNDDFFVSYF